MNLRRKNRGLRQERPIALGLTGSVASGKSTALEFLKEKSWAVLSADEIVHEIYQEKGLDLEELRRRALQSKAALKKLEKLVHPRVKDRVHQILSVRSQPTVVEIPLLFEAGMGSEFDFNIFIYCPRKERKKRALSRGMSAQLFDFLEAQQWNSERKASAADLSCSNFSRNSLKQQLDKFHQFLLS